MIQPHQPARVAVVGAGAIGRRHLVSLAGIPAFALAGVADPSPDAQAAARAHGVPCFADLQRMLDHVAPDAVVIATPNALHEEAALACIARGVPAMIEKPVAHSVASARRIAAAASAGAVPILVGHHRRFNPRLRAARACIDAGTLGRIVAVTAVDLRRKPDAYYAQAWRREPGGGPLLINGIHDVDCLRYLCGEIVSVHAVKGTAARGFAVEDTAAVAFVFASGALGTLTISDAVQAPWAWEIASGEEPDYPHQEEDCYLIAGTAASLAVPTLALWRNERGGGRGDPFVRTRLAAPPADPWVEELRHFADVVHGRARPAVTVEDAMRTLAVMEAIAEASRSGAAAAVATP
ncbi:MAG TPA: Gfo/Idh/MocA family oxidoreductase [Casimicrobiaceae bacterium]|nr:Gfo/Idh/MocA family oxidoreductase [Casimicrobiaceae bacterium]